MARVNIDILGISKLKWTKLVEEMELQLSYFKSSKKILWKCCTQYASEFGKLSSGHRAGKGQFSFQSQRKACQRMFKLPHNCTHLTWYQNNAQNSPSLVLTVLKFTTVNFQMFKLDWEKAEEPEIKLPTSIGSSKKQNSSRKTYISVLLTMPKPLTIWITTNWEILKEVGTPDHLTCLLRNLYAGQEGTVRTGHGTTDWFQLHHVKCWAGWSTTWIAWSNINNLRYADDTTFMP